MHIHAWGLYSAPAYSTKCWCFIYAEFTTAVKLSDSTCIFTGAHADHRGKIITVITKSLNFHLCSAVFMDIQAYIPKVKWISGFQTTDMTIHLPLCTAEDTASTGLPARDMERKRGTRRNLFSAFWQATNFKELTREWIKRMIEMRMGGKYQYPTN